MKFLRKQKGYFKFPNNISIGCVSNKERRTLNDISISLKGDRLRDGDHLTAKLEADHLAISCL